MWCRYGWYGGMWYRYGWYGGMRYRLWIDTCVLSPDQAATCDFPQTLASPSSVTEHLQASHTHRRQPTAGPHCGRSKCQSFALSRFEWPRAEVLTRVFRSLDVVRSRYTTRVQAFCQIISFLTSRHFFPLQRYIILRLPHMAVTSCV